MVDQFQFTVGELLIRNKSILDLITKFQDSNARVNRVSLNPSPNVVVKVNAEKQVSFIDADFDEVRNLMNTH